jgi:hypothetical protein
MEWKQIVITGASSGLGAVLARRLSGPDRKVFALARSEEKLRALEAESDGQIVGLPVDITEPEQIAAAYERIETEFGPIDVLINNAGVLYRQNFWEQELETIDQMLDINLKGALYCTRLLLPYLLERRRGYIINVASVGAFHGAPRAAVYAASKHGMLGFADSLTQELLPYSIRVTTICPGGINTPLWRDDRNPYPWDNKEQLMAPEEVAEVIEFLLTRPSGTVYKNMVFFPSNEWH